VAGLGDPVEDLVAEAAERLELAARGIEVLGRQPDRGGAGAATHSGSSSARTLARSRRDGLVAHGIDAEPLARDDLADQHEHRHEAAGERLGRDLLLTLAMAGQHLGGVADEQAGCGCGHGA
jgi:hypothetical protein